MDTESVSCKNCNANEWRQIVSVGYPERRKERDQTIKTVYECQSCGSEGKHFEHNSGTKDIYSGAMRE